MRSFGAFLTSGLIRLITFPTRLTCASLSAKITAKPQKYSPPKDMRFKRFTLSEPAVFAEALRPENFHGYILHFHGGGRTAPLNNFYRKTAARLARLTGAAVISVDYPTGDYFYPVMHDYCFSAYRACTDLFPIAQTILVGDSYGANLALSCMLRARDASRDAVRRLFLMRGESDRRLSGERRHKRIPPLDETCRFPKERLPKACPHSALRRAFLCRIRCGRRRWRR